MLGEPVLDALLFGAVVVLPPLESPLAQLEEARAGHPSAPSDCRCVAQSMHSFLALRGM